MGLEGTNNVDGANRSSQMAQGAQNFFSSVANAVKIPSATVSLYLI